MPAMNSSVCGAFRSRSTLSGVDPAWAGFVGSIPTAPRKSLKTTSSGWTSRSAFVSFQP